MALTKISSSEISTGAITADKIATTVSLGGPKITTVNVANSAYTVLDDTAVNVGGGYLVITGSGFESGAQVIIDTTPATSTTFVNSTTLRAEVPTKSAATYNLYVANPDGGTALKVNGLTYSGIPTWVTSSTLANVTSNTAFTGNLSATGATSYSNTTSLPSGFTLVSANGYYYGNISVSSDTTYSFTVRATDAELQESDRTFSLTATIVPNPTADILLVGGGGAGGGANDNNAGGGGAGGYLVSNTYQLQVGTTYNITIGAGGAQVNAAKGNDGSSTTAFGVTAQGGGAGGGKTSGTGNNGGSGGGGQGFPTNSAGGSATQTSSGSFTGYGFAGGNGSGSISGGGGGAGEAGNTDAANYTYGGAGGDGRTWVDGVTYAGGGGGGHGGSGGDGGGGAGGGGGPSSLSGVGTEGSVNTGGGGGGTYQAGGGTNLDGANGGSGVVIIRYADTYAAATSTTGSPTITVAGGYRIYKFTGSGSFTL